MRPCPSGKALGSVTVLTVACYWPSSHCIPAQKFVCVRVGGVKSQPFTVGVGLRQKCVLSPFLLMVCYMNWIASHSRVDEGVIVGS